MGYEIDEDPTGQRVFGGATRQRSRLVDMWSASCHGRAAPTPAPVRTFLSRR